MTNTRAIQVLDILNFYCGFHYNKFDEGSFIYQMSIDCPEYRFQGDLGFGGKLYNCKGDLRVSCYPEDDTPERRAMIHAANQELEEI